MPGFFPCKDFALYLLNIFVLSPFFFAHLRAMIGYGFCSLPCGLAFRCLFDGSGFVAHCVAVVLLRVLIF